MDLYVARQPIFDAAGEVAGYELLYRRGAQSAAADGTSVAQMSRDTIVQAFLEIGLDNLTRGRPAFINFSREMLLGRYYDLLDPEEVVVELLETVEADAEVLAACERLRRAGYQLALDDFVADERHAPLLRFANIVKMDVLNRSPEEIREASEPLRALELRLLAERVETAEVRDACLALGFELFQGYFFSRPELVSKRGMSVEQTTIVELMNQLNDEDTPDQVIENAFRRDASLSYKLLRMVNAASSSHHGIESIHHAIRLLGRDTLHRWLGLLFASSLAQQGGLDAERAHAAVVRARLCELMGASAGRVTTGPLFIVGLFSMMDALLHAPMEEILTRVDLTADVREALLHRQGSYAHWLELVEAYEAGDWDAVSRQAAVIGLSPADVSELYLQSLQWARDQVSAANA